MKKRIIAIVIMTVMALGVFAFMGCDLSNDLTEYKASAVTEIQDHANTKIAENDYTEQGLEAIATAIVDGKEAVNNATTRASVTTERDKAIQAIDEVPKKDVEFTTELEVRINADYLAEFGHELFFGDELLNKFYGIYNGAAVFFIAGEDTVLKTAVISGVQFSYNYSWTILVWKDGFFYDLENIQAIFDAGILTQSDLEQIGTAHAEAHANEVPKEEDLEMTEELENRIKADYLQEFGYNFWYDRFYGLYSGSAVFFIAADEAFIKTVTISGIEFTYNYGWTILVWKDRA